MATLALGVVGSAVGGALLPGVSFFGATLTGAAIGQAAGAVAGGLIDQALFGASGQSRSVEGPRLSDVRVMGSSEGTPIPRIYGRARLSGQLIWATPFEEEAVTTSTETGGGGGGGGGKGRRSNSSTTTRTDYFYYANFAVGICEGEITRIGRVWADGKELDLSRYNYRVYLGREDQLPDSLIEAKLGSGEVPAYRGLAYIVFEHLALERFGNRLPQLSFEVFRAVDNFEKTVRAVNIIPAAGEFAYEVGQVTRDAGGGVTVSENVHTSQGGSDWRVAMNQLQASLPNVKRGALVVSWFGDDVRAGQCALRPGVEIAAKSTRPYAWSVGGTTRSGAHLVSTVNGRPAFGGTPADASIVSAIQDMKARGLGVTFYPFILMDIAAGNTLPNPYGGTGQAVYPWRGRMTVDPAPGQSGSPDKSPAAATQLANFIGSAQPGNFSVNGTTVTYGGPVEWSYRRMILHYAHLCAAAGGVDTFLIGSEMRGLTWVRDGAASYPFVDALVQLAGDVKSILGSGTLVTYAADWSEYFGHQPSDGSGDVYFHLDPLWASANIDAVGIDVYWPLADWRDGDAHADRQAGYGAIHDLDYLRANIRGGEGYDWYYASAANRDAQIRTPITDGYGTPWVFRFKDIQSWWSSAHFNRPGGVPVSSPTAWLAQSKPIWFTEMGCPAVDKGANQPNVFYDPKSSESFLPYYSRGFRDDFIQRRYIQAIYDYHDPAHEDYDLAVDPNPVSSVYGGRMVDLANVFVYTWDARPSPAFPNARSVWADGDNWQLGHWLTGRVGGGSLAAIVAAILVDYDFSEAATGELVGMLDGYVLDRVMSARQALQSLELAFFFDAIESGGLITFRHRGRANTGLVLAPDDLVEVRSGEPLLQLTRGQETELPGSSKITYLDGARDYHRGAVESRRLAGASTRVASAGLPIVMAEEKAQNIAEAWLHDAWLARERVKFSLPPSRLALEAGDIVTLDHAARNFTLRLTGLSEGISSEIEARSIDPDVFEETPWVSRVPTVAPPPVFGPSLATFLDLPIIREGESEHAGYVAAFQSPWPGGVAFYRSPELTGYSLKATASSQATMGVTSSDFYVGPIARYDYNNRLTVQLDNGALASVSDLAMLGGQNLAAVENADGEWEVFQFRDATLVAANTYELSVLLRGQIGTEPAMRSPVAGGARFVVIDRNVTAVDMALDEIDLAFNWLYGPANLDIGHQSYQQTVRAFNGLGLRPLSPVHLGVSRSGNDVEFNWIRRTRIGGDNWETVEVPLGEAREAYEAYQVDILDGTTVKRTLSVSEPRASYSEADQIADWGALQNSYDITVYQISDVFGRGAGANATL